MVNQCVKILFDDDTDEVEHPVWHLINPANGEAPRTLCSGEAVGFGESVAVCKFKTVKRGGVTCPDCIEHIKLIKQVRL